MTDHRVFANVKIYSNFAEIIQPLGKLPLEFSAEEWSDIRSDSITLIGSNINITQQTITEKKQSLNNLQIYVRSPSSSNTETKFLRATMIDENRNLVKLIDKDVSKEAIYITVQSDHIVYNDEPSQSKYYVNFTYDTTDAVYLSYLRSNLNWKTRYQLNLFEESKQPIIIAMADIRNDGKSKIDIEHGELIGGEINLRMFEQHRSERYEIREHAVMYAPANAHFSTTSSPPTVSRGEELAGLYLFSINQSFSIDGKTNYLLPMFRPQVTVERYGLIRKSFFGVTANSNGKAQRSYRLSSDRFLSRGNCIIREYDHLVGETFLPDLAANDKHDFSVGQDSDIIYKENITLISSRTYNQTIQPASKEFEERTQSVYFINLLLQNFKKNRSVKVEYKQNIYARSVKLTVNNAGFIQDGSIIKLTTTLSADDEKFFSYRIEIIH
ncbi:unnamed protein product [Rotaria sordida]|uniref:Uncharacterized protein n=2 Tax=Rotaria sordida TaxID=392033 RepID=A0A819PDD1_9BILA|nr:unnamed protein product [Rotaria sordida]CAF4011061.1 unnamed protein product [Rotaria sordida]